MLPYITIFGLALPLPPLILLLGLWLGISIAERYADLNRIAPSHLYNLIFYSLITGGIGARLTYVANFPSIFVDNPGDLISPNPDLFDPLGGFIVGIIVALIYIQRNRLSFWTMWDALTPAFATFSIALSLSDFTSGNSFGSPTTLPWGIDLWGATRHPTQLYETLGAGIILWVLWPGRTRGKTIPGTLFLRFVTYSAAIRLFLVAFQGDSLVTIHNLRVSQIIAWLILALSLGVWYSLIQEKGEIKENPVK